MTHKLRKNSKRYKDCQSLIECVCELAVFVANRFRINKTIAARLKKSFSYALCGVLLFSVVCVFIRVSMEKRRFSREIKKAFLL